METQNQKNAKCTSLLPPFLGARLAWSLSGEFSNDPHSQESARIARKHLEVIKEKAQADPLETRYIISAVTTIDATMRSLDTVFKGRNLNFEENEKIRVAYLDNVTDTLSFGKKANDFVKSLPTMAIVTAGGTVPIVEFLNLKPPAIWAISIGLAGLGFLINIGIVRLMRRRSQNLYIQQDYDRTLYYDQYVKRVATILTSLYLDLDRIHKSAFAANYPVEEEEEEIVERILKGIRPTFCPYVHKHIRENLITPELWSICDSGDIAAVKFCPFWKREGGTPPANP